MSGAMYAEEPTPPSMHQMGQARLEREPHLRAWLERKRLREGFEAAAIRAAADRDAGH